MHGIIWGLLGAAAGLAFVAGIWEWRLLGRVVTAGFVGGFLGAAAFELIGALAFAQAQTDEPVSATWTTRLLARLLVTVGVGVALVLVLRKRPVAQARTQGERQAVRPGTLGSSTQPRAVRRRRTL